MSLRLYLTPTLWAVCTLILLFTALSTAANAPIPLPPEQLGGNERYLAYVSTDKPVYRQGENVYLRTMILNAADNTPTSTRDNSILVKITGPKGDIVHEGSSYGTGSSIGFQWEVPDGIAGGQYIAKVVSPTLGTPETERAFEVRAFRAPRIKTQIQFTRDGYGPGDLVKASVAIERAEGGVPQGALVTAIARLDGKEIYRSNAVEIANSGVVDAAFGLPDTILVGDGNLSFVIEDDGVVETASKSLPILLQKMDISFYPESGELVAGLQSRVYFQALLSNGKPADVEGHIVELNENVAGTNVVAKFKSTHEGRGLFTITPEIGKRYAAIFTVPSGISHPAALPVVSHKGAVINSHQAAFDFNQHIELSVASSASIDAARITLHKREVLLDSQNIGPGLSKLDAKDAEGVLIATVWDRDGHPLAERLIYRHARFGLNIELKVSEGSFIPGEKVSVDVLTTDDQGKPVEAVVGLTVTDDSVLELIETRQQAPRLPAMVYLENEVLDLADAHVYFDKFDTQAATAIDLLLGTQGWRRFVLVNYNEIKNQYPSQIARTMAENNRAHYLSRRLEGGMGIGMEFSIVENVALMAIAEAGEVELLAKNPLEDTDNDEALQIVEPEPEAKQEKEDDARQFFEFANQGIAQDKIAESPPLNMGYVREFAFQARANRKPNERTDFTETLYWNSGVKTGARNGRATIEFSLSDSVTTFRVMADGYGRNGALGAADALIASVEPFYITTKMPLHAVAGDVIELPVTLVNTTSEKINNATISISGVGVDDEQTTPITLSPGQRLRTIVKLTATKAGSFPITVVSQAGPYKDSVSRTLTVTPKGFPVAINEGGLLSSSTPFKTMITLPNDISEGSLSATAKVFPSPLASMEEALNALLREPHGCFEQTSSTNYPLVMAQQYFDTHTGVDPELIAKTKDLLKTGYSKLIGFESKDHGYEWFGANPAHEALTAYGLMEFTDMAKVMQVDNDMIERTRQWLLDRRDGKGGFKRNEQALDSFGGAPDPITNAYIVWSLLESGQSAQSLNMEVQQVKDTAFSESDSYQVALAANILYLSGDIAGADLLAQKLINASNNDGAVQGAATSITGSGGDSLSIETTSLSILAWLRNDKQWSAQVEKSMKWLFERSKVGRFGSTQSTVLALKAINTYDAARAVPKKSGSVQLFINGEEFEEPVVFNTDSKGVIELPDFSSAVSSGKHDIELRMSNGSKMPFALEVSYNTPLPVNNSISSMRLSSELSHSNVTEGEPLELQVSVSALNDHVSTPVAIVGIPAGVELQHDQLKELVGKGTISAYEVRGSELVLYWRGFTANESRSIPIKLIAQVPGNYTAASSRVYPYYTDENKHWEAGHSIEVVAR